ncbi:imidazolonepropionase [Alteribacter natronophilus]|uniref:imidazolonepropionase n=1 Tax=Alteribacter natronophilus TaxID=2583810 RepID=UPI00110DA1AF|nr:imidazolonepropionase [Alteribacter natronophilus]TMW70645.1 imidazolonepropionase [Alteribacter natronophilus]
MSYVFVKNANELLTVAGSSSTPAVREQMNELSIIENGAVWIENDRIVETGTTADLEKKYADQLDQAQVIDAKGKVVAPGLVDPHTHLVFAGSRENEYNMRLQGAKYMDIMAKGGGIHATTRATRKASFEQLYSESRPRLDSFLKHGVTTVEAKSGYGMDWDVEKRQMEVARKLGDDHVVDVVGTFMGAHVIAEEYKDDPEAFVDIVVNEMIPAAAESGLAEFNDVFCERGVYTPEQSRRILEAGREYGLLPKIHADEIEPYGGAEIAAEVGAVSADHLLKVSDRGLEMMAEKGVVAVLLPGTAFFLMTEAADGRKAIDAGVPVALSTDRNPGSSPSTSMPFMMNLASLTMGMTPAEAITASTINAAHAIRRGETIGSLEAGKQADLVIWDIPNHLQFTYLYGVNHTHTVVKKGRVVVENGVIV